MKLVMQLLSQIQVSTLSEINHQTQHHSIQHIFIKKVTSIIIQFTTVTVTVTIIIIMVGLIDIEEESTMCMVVGH